MKKIAKIAPHHTNRKFRVKMYWVSRSICLRFHMCLSDCELNDCIDFSTNPIYILLVQTANSNKIKETLIEIVNDSIPFVYFPRRTHYTLAHTHTHRLFLSTHSTLHFYFSLCSQKKVASQYCWLVLFSVSARLYPRSFQTKIERLCAFFLFFSIGLLYQLVVSSSFVYYFVLRYSLSLHISTTVCICVFCDRFRWTIMTVVSQYVVFSLEFIYLVCYTQLQQIRINMCAKPFEEKNTTISMFTSLAHFLIRPFFLFCSFESHTQTHTSNLVTFLA